MSQAFVNLLICSDLHLDVGDFNLRAHIEKHEQEGDFIDAVILAGDIMEPALGSPIAYALHHVPSHIPALFVPGNHDYYGKMFGNIANIWRAQALNSHVHLLDNAFLVIPSRQKGEIVVVGSTLWSNLQSFGPVVEAELKMSIARQIADFACMKASNGKPWSVQEMLNRFQVSYDFLKNELSDEKLKDNVRRVVVTHFGPHRHSVMPHWLSEDLSAYFSNHLPELVEKADLWIHGHTHDQFEYDVGYKDGLGKVICHPRGYAVGSEKVQALEYKPRLIKVPVNRVPWD